MVCEPRTSGHPPCGVASADLNGDGVSDLVTTSYAADSERASQAAAGAANCA